MKTVFLSMAASLFLTFPPAMQAQSLLPPDRPIGEVIDHYVDAKLQQVKVTPAPPAADTALVRRLYLDLIGRIPAAVEARQLASQPLDRSKLIESLVSTPAFARHNASEFDVLLRNRNTDATSLQPYLLDAFQENRQWDAIFRDLLGAPEPARSDTPVNADPGKPVTAKADDFVLRRLKDADGLTRDVSSVFFGLNITCAQCHHHPEIKGLTQDYFFGMKAFFGYSYEFQGKLLERQHVKVADFKAKSGETRKVSMMFLSGTKVERDDLPEKELVAAIAEETRLIQEKTKDYAKTKELQDRKTKELQDRRMGFEKRLADLDKAATERVKKQWPAGESATRKVTDDERQGVLTDAEKKSREEGIAGRNQIEVELKTIPAPPVPPAPKQSARKRLAEIALDETNRGMFARSIINRLWFRFYGHGLVMRVDQMHAENPASHPELLDWLARDFIAHKYDLKRLITGLVSSRAYARSSEWKGKPPAKELFAVAPTRPLTPAQWGMSYHFANQPDVFKPDDPVEVRQKKLADVEKGGGNFPFIEQPFDDFQVAIDEPLKLSNDEGILKGMGGKLIPVLRKLPDTRQQIDEATWTVLSRPATFEEHQLFAEYLEQRKDRPDEGLRQVIWALVNNPEFRFNH